MSCYFCQNKNEDELTKVTDEIDKLSLGPQYSRQNAIDEPVQYLCPACTSSMLVPSDRTDTCTYFRCLVCNLDPAAELKTVNIPEYCNQCYETLLYLEYQRDNLVLIKCFSCNNDIICKI